jgi:hypothetical protein
VRRALSTDPARALRERTGTRVLGPSEGLLLVLA